MGISQLNPFGTLYAQYYDLFHQNKNYQREIKQLVFTINNFLNAREIEILDFGCGTGGHASELSKLGYSVSGYDPNKFMIGRATSKHPHLFFTSSLEDLRTFDVTYSLFDVISYQITEADLQIYLNQLKKTLKPGGFLIFDGWNSSGVQVSPPTNSDRDVKLGAKTIRRSVIADYDPNTDVTALSITLTDLETGIELETELHKLKAYDTGTLGSILASNGFREISIMDGSNWSKSISEDSWRFAMIFQNLI
jgi:SAM-dependent methyltransferase